MFIIGEYVVKRDFPNKWAIFNAEDIGVSLHVDRLEAIQKAVGYNGGDPSAPIYYTTFACKHCAAEIHVQRAPVGWAESPIHCGHPAVPTGGGALNVPPAPRPSLSARIQMSLGIEDEHSV